MTVGVRSPPDGPVRCPTLVTASNSATRDFLSGARWLRRLDLTAGAGFRFFASFGYLPRSGVVESCGNSMSKHLRNCQIVSEALFSISTRDV